MSLLVAGVAAFQEHVAEVAVVMVGLRVDEELSFLYDSTALSFAHGLPGLVQHTLVLMGDLVNFFSHTNFIALYNCLSALDALANLEGLGEALVHVVLLRAVHFNRLHIQLIEDTEVL